VIFMQKWIWQLAIVMIAGIFLFAAFDAISAGANKEGKTGAEPSQYGLPPASAGAGGKDSGMDEKESEAFNPKSLMYQKAPEFESYAGVINDQNGDDFLSSSELKGKVVLVDIWTYSCINCIRTLPYIQAWHEKYADSGLVIVGVHSPEFEFEKKRENIEDAAKRNNLTYPTIIDNDRKIWNAFKNSYWPRKYLIDADGYIRYDHIGEGGYDETERQIQSLLKELNPDIKSEMANVSAEGVDFSQIQTPELYFGSSFRRVPLGNQKAPILESIAQNYTLPGLLAPNIIYLEGEWKNNGETMELASNEGAIEINYGSQSVHLVAESARGSTASAFLGEELHIGPEANGQGEIAIGGSRLYRIVKTDEYARNSLKIKIKGAGFKAYAFTFG